MVDSETDDTVVGTSKLENEDLYRVGTLDYVSFVKLSFDSLVQYWNRYVTHFRADYEFPRSFLDDVSKNCFISSGDLVLVMILGVFWTLLRVKLTKFCLPYAERLQLCPASNVAKVPETIWKLIFYSCTFAWSIYVMLISGRYSVFFDPLSIWDDWKPNQAVPWDIYLTYLVQASFYLHSVYGTIYMDMWRKDSVVMIVHHILTLALMGFSYAAKHHLVGALVLLLHDITDVELEFTKINTYLKYRGGKYYVAHEIMASCGFASFAFSWFWFRLYWYPLKVLYVGLYGSFHMAPFDVPFIPVFNFMLWFLFAMNAWWFHFILVALYKLATGQMEELNDTREFKEQQAAQLKAEKLKEMEVNGSLANGPLKENCLISQTTSPEINGGVRERHFDQKNRERNNLLTPHPAEEEEGSEKTTE